MNTEKILKLIYRVLPNEIKNNPSYRELSKIYMNITKDIPVYDISIRTDLIEKEQRLLDYTGIAKISSSIETLFQIYTKTSEFSLSMCNGFSVIVLNTMKDLEEGVTNVVEIEVTIDKDKTLWRTADYHKNENEYYFDYNIDMYAFNKDGDKIEIPDKDSTLDEDYSATFGIPLENARICRQNFDKYKEYLNNSKAKMIMEDTDSLNFGYFILPFKIDELNGIFTGLGNDDSEELTSEETEAIENFESLDENDEEIEDETYDEYEITDELIEKAQNITKQLETQLGTEGLFTMSMNLFNNITDYTTGKVSVLQTTGRFIRKLNDNFTVYYVNINENSVISFKKDITKEEAKRIYEEDPENDYMEGLKEFFDINKTKKLEN